VQEKTLNEIEEHYKMGNPNKMGEFSDLNEIPLIYHYTRTEAFKNIISSNRFWLSNCHFLNDSAEIHYTIDLAERIFKSREYNRNTAELLHHYIETAQDINNQFILSTSYKKDNLTLWYNYGTNDGYNIGLDLRELAQNLINSGDFGILMDNSTHIPAVKGVLLYDKVQYDINEQEKIIHSIFNYFEELVSKENNLDIVYAYRILTIHNLLICSLFFKHQSFKEESEFRIVLNVHTGLDKVVKFRTSNGCLVPYCEIGMEFGKPKRLPIKEVLIGPRNKLDIAQKGVDAYLNYYGYNNVYISKTQVPLRF